MHRCNLDECLGCDILGCIIGTLHRVNLMDFLCESRTDVPNVNNHMCRKWLIPVEIPRSGEIVICRVEIACILSLLCHMVRTIYFFWI